MLLTKQSGFTLIELLVAMTISLVVMAAIYYTYTSQQRTFVVQDQVAAMQQNLRASLHAIKQEIRVAGCDPLGSAGAGIVTASNSSVRFTMDIHDGIDNDGDAQIDEYNEAGNGDGDLNDINEDITYLILDPDGDGHSDLYKRDASLGTDSCVAENIDALDLVYLDSDGNPTANLSEIRSVQISIVARTNHRMPSGYKDDTTYLNQQGTAILGPQNDPFRRKQLGLAVECRNLFF